MSSNSVLEIFLRPQDLVFVHTSHTHIGYGFVISGSRGNVLFSHANTLPSKKHSAKKVGRFLRSVHDQLDGHVLAKGCLTPHRIARIVRRLKKAPLAQQISVGARNTRRA